MISLHPKTPRARVRCAALLLLQAERDPTLLERPLYLSLFEGPEGSRVMHGLEQRIGREEPLARAVLRLEGYVFPEWLECARRALCSDSKGMSFPNGSSAPAVRCARVQGFHCSLNSFPPSFQIYPEGARCVLSPTSR